MCGYLGFFGDVNVEEDLFEKALNLQIKRGPDHQSIYKCSKGLLGHTRLSIIDTSSNSNQPMFSACGGYALLFNGEIYNYKELADSLDLSEDTTFGDTTVLLNYIIRFGINKSLNDISGMFSFSFYDINGNKVYFARDIAGEKPLYYSVSDGLYVSSNLLSIVALTKNKRINEQVLSDFLHYGYCKGTDSIIEGVLKLQPGCYATYNIKNSSLGIDRYFDINEQVEQNLDLHTVLENAVSESLVSDVPVGVFLSGGVDSSLIASYVSKVNKDIEAYTIGFVDKNYDESLVARSVAKQLSMKINVLYLDEVAIMNTLDELHEIFDEPFADASAIATYRLAKFARSKGAKVCLGGDGGDELFVGYNRHLLVPKLYKYLGIIPFSLRTAISKVFNNKGCFTTLSFFVGTINKLLGKNINALDEKLMKLVNLLSFSGPSDLLFKVQCGNDYSNQLDLPEPSKIDCIDFEDPKELSKIDFETYLHEDVLVKVDRSTMAASLEARAPLLNKSLIRFSSVTGINNEPTERVINKSELREKLYESLDRKSFERPKTGFSVPYKRIVDTKIKEYFMNDSNILDESRFKKEALKVVKDYYSGKNPDYKFVWNYYCFVRWSNLVNEI
ncbi:asparagine synthase (glutamine-hydrolyzing) [Vibrio cyclitrophicus]|uniref:asparagine synthase (glutamine-hydrolyzing) n=1 Tax=Vibrio cyclitrophicus TaxID=47951 RepID=UPI000310F281|nr:asparagine synthase (glutamine-hydrolyzing) [Vibrio cyclitrophicus]OEE10481.1 asparagine synthase (glutamine-hydrolyzing) [Vibrio cyclitrophicus ZF207]